MSISADTLKRIAALHLAPEAMQEVLSIIASCIEPLEERRRRERARKHKQRRGEEESPQNVTALSEGQSRDSHADSPPYEIKTLPPSSKPKRVSRYREMVEVPEVQPDEAKDFARAKGWEEPRLSSEWQRFRDHSLSRGKKHKNVLAAWRNWVTSPYQANGGQNGNGRPAETNRSASAGADRVLERLKQFSPPGH